MNLGLTADQVAQRRLGIGGSDAGRIMAGDWVRLWREKTGRQAEEDLSGNLAVQMGSATEAFNAHWYSKTTGRAVERRSERVQHRLYPYIVANLDGVTLTGKGEAAYWDAKHVGRLDEQTVLRYTPQMVHCCAILGLDWWVLSVFVGNGKHEIVEQEVDPFYQASLLVREREFWDYVERDEEPPEEQPRVLAPKPTPKLREIIVPTERDGVFEALVQQNNWLPEACQQIRTFVETHGAATVNALAREELKKLVPEDVGTLRRGRFKLARDKAGAIRLSVAKLEKDASYG